MDKDLKLAEARRSIEIRRKQLALAMGGDVRMLIWLGKQYLGQSDKVETRSEVENNTQMKLTPEIEEQIKKAAQVVRDDPNIPDR